MNRLLMTTLLATSLVAGCTDDSPAHQPLSAATFNAGLAPGDVDLVDQRAPKVVQALAAEAAQLDVLCVQEFWRAADWNALASATSDELPHAIRLPAKPGAPATCSPTELGPLATCAQDNCAGLSGAALADCGTTACVPALEALSGTCATCVVEAVNAGGDISAVEQTCMGTGASADSRLYDGVYDTGLLTRPAPVAQDLLVLDSYLVRSAVHYAKLDTADGPVNVFCAHLGSSIVFSYAGPYGSWEGEHTHQVQQLIQFIQIKAAPSERVMVLGDLNMGPQVGDLAGELPIDYATLIATGLRDPAAESSPPLCTLCPDNTLRDPTSRPRLIDHILTRGFTPVPEVQRFLTEPVSIEADAGSPDAGTSPEASNLSDHYGLVTGRP